MQRLPREAVRLRLRQGLDLPLELIQSPLLRELYLRRYLRHSQADGCWRCTLCGGRVKGTHMTVHTCLPNSLPAWSRGEMQASGLLSEDGGRCRLCKGVVGASRPHVCRSPLVRTLTADLSALVEPWRGLDQESYTPLRRLQGQIVVIMPEEALMQQPQLALDTGALMMFQGVVALSEVVAAGQAAEQLLLLEQQQDAADGSGGSGSSSGEQQWQQQQQDEANRPGDSSSSSRSSSDEPLHGRGLGVYSLLGLEKPRAAAAAAAAQPRQPGHPRLQQTWVCLYTGRLQMEINEGDQTLTAMRVFNWRFTKSAFVEPAKEGGVAVLLNCGHGQHANAKTDTVWRPDLGDHMPYIKAVQDAPPGTEVLYDYNAVTDDADEYRDFTKNPVCGCGCGSHILAYQP